jgi:DNA-binding PadR family transcriptional regulator
MKILALDGSACLNLTKKGKGETNNSCFTQPFSAPGVFVIDKGETNRFMKGTSLGEFEELVLLTVGILYDDAYGLGIRDELEKQTGRNVMISSVHKALVRLEDKGFLDSHMGGATDERGGRKKRLYELTVSGKRVLSQSRELRNSMWNAVPKAVWE